MMSGSEGEGLHGKTDILSEDTRIIFILQIRARGEWVKKIRNFCVPSLMEAPTPKVSQQLLDQILLTYSSIIVHDIGVSEQKLRNAPVLTQFLSTPTA